MPLYNTANTLFAKTTYATDYIMFSLHPATIFQQRISTIDTNFFLIDILHHLVIMVNHYITFFFQLVVTKCV